MKLSFKKNNKIYIIEKKDDESNEIFLKRVDYIIEKKEISNDKLENIINLSYIWRNITIYKMEYSSSVVKKI